MNKNQKRCQHYPGRCIAFIKSENHFCYTHTKKLIQKIVDDRILSYEEQDYMILPEFKNDLITFIEKSKNKNSVIPALIDKAKKLIKLKEKFEDLESKDLKEMDKNEN